MLYTALCVDTVWCRNLFGSCWIGNTGTQWQTIIHTFDAQLTRLVTSQLIQLRVVALTMHASRDFIQRWLYMYNDSLELCKSLQHDVYLLTKYIHYMYNRGSVVYLIAIQLEPNKYFHREKNENRSHHDYIRNPFTNPESQ